MVTVEFLGPIKKEKINLEVKNLQELRENLQKDEELKKWLEISAVAVNDSLVNSLNIDLQDGDKVCILPPVCGG